MAYIDVSGLAGITLLAGIDPVTRDFYLSAATVDASIHPIDIYKEMRICRNLNENLRGYDLFLAAFGNVAKGGGKFTERYVQQLLGTRFIPFDISHELTVIGTVITDDGQEGVACFDRSPLTATTIVDISYVPPQVEVVRAEAELAAIRQASFGGVVAVDFVGGISGTDNAPDGTPIGTHKVPSNNWADATTIAAREGFERFIGYGTLPITTGDDLTGYTIQGENPITTFVTVDAAAVVTDIHLKDLILTNSVMDGYAYFDHVSMFNVSGVEGYLENCVLSGTITLTGTTDTFIIDSKSGCVGLGDTDLPKLDFNAEEHHLAVRNWSGPVKMQNSNNALTTICCDINSGATVIVDSTVNNGELTVRGSGKITHTQTGAENIIDETTEAQVWAEDISSVTDINAAGYKLDIQNKLLRNRTVTDLVAGTMTVYDDDNVTVLFTCNLWENVAGTTPYEGNAVNRRDKLA